MLKKAPQHSQTVSQILLPIIGLLVLVVALWLPFGLKRPDRMEGWVLMNEAQQLNSPISPNLDGTGRPLVLLPWFLAAKFDPNSFFGAELLLMALLFGKGLTFYALLKRLFSTGTLFAFFAAALFVVYPSDSGTIDTRVLNIHTAVLLYLVAVYLLVVFWQSTKRKIMVGTGIAAIIAVTMSAATYEAVYPLIIFTPLILLWRTRRNHFGRQEPTHSPLPLFTGGRGRGLGGLPNTRRITRRFVVTAGVWYLGPFIYALYWVSMRAGTLPDYQNHILQNTNNSLSQMLAGLQHAYVQNFWTSWNDALRLIHSDNIGIAVLATFLIACAAVGLRDAGKRANFSLGVLGLVIFFLGFLIYIPTSLRTDTWRVFLYAAIGAALTMAVLVQEIASLFPAYARKLVFIGLGSLLILLGILSAFEQQQIFADNSAAQEQILVAFAQQAPKIHLHTLILLFDDPADMGAYRVFWLNIYFENAVKFLYADNTLQARFCYPNLGTWGEWADRCQLGDQQVTVEGGGFGEKVIKPYSQILAFRYSATDGATLLQQIPTVYRPGIGSDSYNPAQVIDFSSPRPSHVAALLSNSPVPAPPFPPIVDGETIGLGQSWYPPEFDGRQTFQWVNNDAEFIVGAEPQPSAIIQFEVAPGPGVNYQPFTLKVLDTENQVVTSIDVSGKQDVVLSVPLNPNRGTLFRLHIDGGGQTNTYDSRILNFRVYKISVLSVFS